MSISSNTRAAVEWKIRQYGPDDLSATVALENLVLRSDGLDFVMTDEEQQAIFRRPGFNPEKRVLVVEGPRVDGVEEGTLVAYGLMPSVEDEATGERIYTIEVYVHPAAREYGLVEHLVKHFVEMARQEEASSPPSSKRRADIRIDVAEKQHYLKVLSERAGLKMARQFLIMECPLDKLDEPQPVEGITLRDYRVSDDHAAALEAYNHSFIDHYDFRPSTPERWEYRLSDPTMRPDLSWVAEVDGEPGKLAGFCLCNIYEEENKVLNRCEGWIGLLGTVRGWRGKGLGRSLLLHGLHSLRSSGLDTGVLGVDSTSPTGANRLYESVGFRTREIWFQYRAALEDVRL